MSWPEVNLIWKIWDSTASFFIKLDPPDHSLFTDIWQKYQCVDIVSKEFFWFGWCYLSSISSSILVKFKNFGIHEMS